MEVSSSAAKLKKKYGLSSFKGAWKSLNEDQFAQLVFDEKKVNISWGLPEVNISNGCNQKNLAICKRSWSNSKNPVLKQFWLQIGEFCNLQTATTALADSKKLMDCSLNSFRNFIENFSINAKHYNSCLEMSRCR